MGPRGGTRTRTGTCLGALLVALPLGLPALPLLAGCTAGPSGGDGDGDGDAPIGPIAFEQFVQDRPSIGGDWYLYDEDGGHALTPFEHVYVVREDTAAGERYGAVRVVSYYDPATADSGLFTFRYATWDGGAWSAATEHVASKNIKSGGPLCFDLFAGAETACDEAAWQVSFKIYRFLVRTGPIVVARPGLFLRQAPLVGETGEEREPVLSATLEGRTSLDGLPNPTTLADLADGAPEGWGDPSYDLSRFAVNLPRAGRVLGGRFVDEGFAGRADVYFLLNALTELVRFTVTPVTDGDAAAGLSFTYALQEVERNDRTLPPEVPELTTVTVPVPVAGVMTFVDFNTPTLLLDTALVDDAHPPDLVPDEGRWELALAYKDGALHLLLSSGAILYNATALDGETDLAAATPPL